MLLSLRASAHTGVAIRFFRVKETDSHTAFCLSKNADVGHWFGMTGELHFATAPFLFIYYSFYIYYLPFDFWTDDK